MFRWNNDYNHGAHPAVLKALADTNGNAYGGYGLDEWCENGAAAIKEYLGGANADIHYLVGGTQANFTVIAAALRPYESVICADSGHIHVHETGAVENTGHKLHALPAVNGKITAGQIAAEAELFRVSGVQEHITEPKLVYISFPTEFGTLYTKKELEEIRNICDEYKLRLYLDGARLAYALQGEGTDVTLCDLGRLCDAFYIGGTKCGSLFGEALIFREEAPMFFTHRKRAGGLLAKGYLLGLQFDVLFSDNLYSRLGKNAIDTAMLLKRELKKKNVRFLCDSPTNQQFVILDNEKMEELEEDDDIRLFTDYLNSKADRFMTRNMFNDWLKNNFNRVKRKKAFKGIGSFEDLTSEQLEEQYKEFLEGKYNRYL